MHLPLRCVLISNRLTYGKFRISYIYEKDISLKETIGYQRRSQYNGEVKSQVVSSKGSVGR